MSYLVLARKYRPQTFAEVVQQAHVTTTLTNAIQAGRVAHAILFAGPRGTGKSHIYKEISPNSILISGGQTTVANLFYNMARRTVGLVGLWDVVAFDEVAGVRFKDPNGVQILKDYMESGSFSRGKEEVPAEAAIVFNGNIDGDIATRAEGAGFVGEGGHRHLELS